MKLCEKNFDLDKKSYFLQSTCVADHSIDMLRVVMQIQERVMTSGLTYIVSRLFYLCKFSFIFHAKCSFPAFCMIY